MKAKDLFPYWPDVHEDLVRCMRFTPDSVLDFRPTPVQMSVWEQYVHIIQVQEYYNNVLGGNALYPQYAREHLPCMEAITAKYEQVYAFTRGYLDTWDLQKLKKIRFDRYDGHWVLTHVYEHAIHHKAQVLVYFRLLGLDPEQRFKE